jgi:hypothetical protein
MCKRFMETRYLLIQLGTKGLHVLITLSLVEVQQHSQHSHFAQNYRCGYLRIIKANVPLLCALVPSLLLLAL